MSGFQKAKRGQRKLKAAIAGPSGSGKTYSALEIATGLLGPGDRIACVDTENYSASLYSDFFDFDVLNLTDCSPNGYIKAMGEAHQEGYQVLVIDSLSHAWRDSLQQVDKLSKKFHGNTFVPWKTVSPQLDKLFEALIRYPGHLIATLRSKMAYEITENEKGKKTPQKIGLEPIMRGGLEYEFDFVADMNLEHELTVSKTRYSMFDGETFFKPDRQLGQNLKSWLDDVVLKQQNTPTQGEQ